MFIEPEHLSQDTLRAIRNGLYQRCQYRPSLELNFIYNQRGEIACFLAASTPYIGYFFVTDDTFTPNAIYRTTAYINACTISDSGHYAICQTANNPSNDEDSGVFIVLDVWQKKVLGKLRLPTGWKGITHLFLDEKKESFFVYYGNYYVEYNFQGKATNKNQLFETQLSIYNGYQLIGLATEITKALSETWDTSLYQKLLRVIDAIGNDVSSVQRASMYKALGDCYFEHHMTDEAISAYEMGLSLNPKLPVKKKLKACHVEQSKQ